MKKISDVNTISQIANEAMVTFDKIRIALADFQKMSDMLIAAAPEAQEEVAEVKEVATEVVEPVAE